MKVSTERSGEVLIDPLHHKYVITLSLVLCKIEGWHLCIGECDSTCRSRESETQGIFRQSCCSNETRGAESAVTPSRTHLSSQLLITDQNIHMMFYMEPWFCLSNKFHSWVFTSLKKSSGAGAFMVDWGEVISFLLPSLHLSDETLCWTNNTVTVQTYWNAELK